MNFNISAAFELYQKQINRTEFFDVLRKQNLRTTGSIPSITWELFGSILTGKKGKKGNGADLEGIEIKSAVIGKNFEYQYHRKTWREKLKEDRTVGHIFCSYNPDYNSCRVYFLEGTQLTPFFDDWEPRCKKTTAPKRGRDTGKLSVTNL